MRVTKDEKAVRRIRTLYTLVSRNRNLKFTYRKSGTLFQIVAGDHHANAVIIDGVSTLDLAQLLVELLTTAAAGSKQLDLLVQTE